MNYGTEDIVVVIYIVRIELTRLRGLRLKQLGARNKTLLRGKN